MLDEISQSHSTQRGRQQREETARTGAGNGEPALLAETTTGS